MRQKSGPEKQPAEEARKAPNLQAGEAGRILNSRRHRRAKENQSFGALDVGAIVGLGPGYFFSLNRYLFVAVKD